MKYKILTILIMIFSADHCYGQIGGLRSFDFLNLPGDAKTAALGGTHISALGNDVNSFVNNPSLLDSASSNNASISYLSFLGGVKFSNLTYAGTLKKLGLWGVNLKYINYGKIDSYDPSGYSLGEFSSNEFVIGVSHGQSTGAFSYGGTLKFALSDIAGFKANAILFDLGGSFTHPHQQLRIGMVFKNIGWIARDYTDLSKSTLPFDVQVGVSFKPEHMPFRFSATIYNLYQTDIAYYDPNSNVYSTDNNAPGIADKVFSHMLFGLEFVPSQNVNIRFGYNHLMRRELKLEEASGGAGLSVGLMFKVKAFEFAYTKVFYHVASSSNQITLTSNFNKLLKKKQLN